MLYAVGSKSIPHTESVGNFCILKNTDEITDEVVHSPRGFDITRMSGFPKPAYIRHDQPVVFLKQWFDMMDGAKATCLEFHNLIGPGTPETRPAVNHDNGLFRRRVYIHVGWRRV